MTFNFQQPYFQGEVDLIISIVGLVFRVPVASVLAKQRGKATIAFGRQVAMYCVHICLGKSFTEVGILFGRDRTTVSHACQLIEDKREDPDIDWSLDLIERSIASLASYYEQQGRLESL